MFPKFRQKTNTVKLIREAIDSYPDGLCFATSGGRPILVNRKMNQLVLRLSGHTILDANRTWRELTDFDCAGGCARLRDSWILTAQRRDIPFVVIRFPDAVIWRFRRTELDDPEAGIVQIEASDITQWYAVSKELYQNNTKLSELHDRQQALLADIVEINRSRELLETKVRIHGELGKCIVATKRALVDGAAPGCVAEGAALGRAADGGTPGRAADGAAPGRAADGAAPGRAADGGTLGRAADSAALTQMWEDAIRHLTSIPHIHQGDAISPETELSKVAEMIGCRVFFRGPRPAERKALLLLYAAVREALTNAVRHADADQLTVCIEDGGEAYHIEIFDNGVRPVEEIREGDGLRDLRLRLEEAGGNLQIHCEAATAAAQASARQTEFTPAPRPRNQCGVRLSIAIPKETEV